MRRLLLTLALLVAGAAPVGAQSDDRWVAIFAPQGTLGKGGDRYGDPGIAFGKNPHVVETMLRRMGVPFKVILLPDSAGGWARQIGDTRDTDEADSTHFRKNGCLGWVSFMTDHSQATSLKGFTGEIRAVFTDAEGNTGVQRGSPTDGNWGIPGVMFLSSTGPTAVSGLLTGVTSGYGVSGHARNRSLFANGDSISTDNVCAHLPAAGEAANFTSLINLPDYDASGDSLPTIAWLYKTSTLYYSVSVDPYMDPKMLMLGIADLFNRAGYTPRRKLNLHIDLDHPYPDATVQTAPSESLFKYTDAMVGQWKFGGAIEAHASETTGGANPDDPTLAARWKLRSAQWPGDPHSHQYMNFFPNSSTWNLSTFADSATKRARWNELVLAIRDTIRHVPARGFEATATFPDNNVYFPDLFIMASAGYTNIRSKSYTTSGPDSLGTPASVNLRRWQQVPGPRTGSDPIATYGLPYAYIEPKTNKLLWVHDSVEHPISSDSLSTASTNFSVSMEGFASRNLASMARMAIWDGGQYWHPDLNVTRGRFMADFYRRFTYFYGRTKNILDVSPVYLPKTPRTGRMAARS